jgi:hypothetical protein
MFAIYTTRQAEPRTNFYGQTVRPFELICYVEGERVDRYLGLDRAQLEEIAADFMRKHTEV